MNELRDIESQLLSWKPRQPSANLKRRLFEQADPAMMPTMPAFAFGRWLAPAMALFIVSVVYFGNSEQYVGLESGSRFALMAKFESNLGTAYSSATPADHNIWVPTFEWTNAGQSIESIGPLKR